MQVLDFVVQGLKHFPEQRRFQFGKGHSVLLDPSEAGAVRLPLLADALRSLLTLELDAGLGARLADPAQPASWMGATLRGDDGTVYRLHRDLKAGAVTLHRANGTAFEVLSKDAGEVAHLLTTALGMPPRDPYVKLFAAPGPRAAREPVAAPRTSTAMMTPVVPLATGTPMPPLATGTPVPPLAPGAPLANPSGWSGPIIAPSAPLTVPGLMTPPAGVVASAAPPVWGSGPTAVLPPNVLPPNVLPPNVLPPNVLPPRPTLPPVAAPLPAATPRPAAALSPALAQKQARVAEIRDMLKTQQEQQALEFELDGINRTRYELDEKMRPLRDLEAVVTGCQASVDAYAALAALPKDFAKQLDVFERQKNAMMEETRRMEEHASDARHHAETMVVPSPFSDRMFQLGMAASVLMLGIAFGGAPTVGPAFRYVGFLHLGGLALAALAVWRWIGLLESKAELAVLADQAREKRGKAQRHFDLETTTMRRLLAELEIKDDAGMTELRERLKVFEDVKAQLQDAKQRLDSVRQAAGPGATPEEYEKMAKRQHEVETKLASIRFLGNERQLNAELQALEEELAQAGAGGTDGGGLGYDRGYGGGGGSTGGLQASSYSDDADVLGDPPAAGSAQWAAPAGDGWEGMGSNSFPPVSLGAAAAPAAPVESAAVLVRAAAEVVGLPPPQLAAQIQTRAVQYLTGFTDRRLVQLHFGEQGDVQVADAAGAWLAQTALPGRDGELVHLAVRLALIEECARRRPAPALVEGWFGCLPELKYPLVAKMLLFLGSVTQVLHFAPRPSLAEGAETVTPL